MKFTKAAQSGLVLLLAGVFIGIVITLAVTAIASPQQSVAPVATSTEVFQVRPTVDMQIFVTPSATPHIPLTSTYIPPTVPIQLNECQMIESMIKNGQKADSVIEYLERSIFYQASNGQKIMKEPGKTTVVWINEKVEINNDYVTVLIRDQTGTVFVVNEYYVILSVASRYRTIEGVCSFE